MDGGVIFYLVLAAIIVTFTVIALVSVTRAKGEPTEVEGTLARFQQKLIDINKVPDPKGRGTVWVPTE